MERPRKNFKPHNFNNFSNFTRKPKKKFEQREKEPAMTVTVRGDDVMKAWRILKKKLANENVLQEIKDRRYYKKPSAKKREKFKEAVRKEHRRQIKQAQTLGTRYKNYDPFNGKTGRH